MKKVLAVLFVLGLASLHLQAGARRFILEGETEKTESRSVESDAKPKPIAGSFPTAAVQANNDNKTSNTAESTTNYTDEANSSYGNYGSPSGSSTETHHVFTNDCLQPKKSC